MIKKSNLIKVLILACILGLLSTIIIVLFGHTYTLKYRVMSEGNNINNFIISVEDNSVVECIDKKLDDGAIKVKLKSKSPGKTFIDIKKIDDDLYSSMVVYVHRFGIITFNEFMGDCTASYVIPISIIIFLGYILLLLMQSYKKSVKENIYQYKNIAYLGMIIYVLGAILSQIITLSNYQGLIDTINDILKMFSFPILVFPIAFVLSILVIASNISLIRKEGFNLKNILGIVLGLFICFFTMIPDVSYKILYGASWIDIHNENGFGLYLYEFLVSVPNALLTYIECILIGTIIISLKSAKQIPSFDRDFIMILGCKIKKDGKLTPLLKGRVDRAIEFSKMQKEKSGKDIIFVPSGGKGEDEIISEAEAMKNYLLEQGIKEDNVLIEDKSKNTFENIAFSNKLISKKSKDAKIAFSTTNYHVFRAGCIATEQNIHIEGIGARTKTYFWVNAFIREFIATLFSEKKKHFAVLICIIVVGLLMVTIRYFNANALIG